MRVALLTVSDRAASGERADGSGPAVRRLVEERGDTVISQSVLPDEADHISAFLTRAADGGDVELVLTIGGTGFAPRDVTPEATRAVLDRETPGLGEAMRAASLARTPMGALSRATSGIRGRALIINLPGSPRAATECLEAIYDAVRHGVDLIQERAAGHPTGDRRQAVDGRAGSRAEGDR